MQKCAGNGPTDYWSRLLSESLTADEPRDQPVLRAIRRANTGASSLDELAYQLFDSKEFSRCFEHFGPAFDKARLPGLASALYEIIRRQMGRNYRSDDTPGFYELWRLMGNSDAVRNDPVLEAWALEELLKSLPGQIHFANELYYFWLGGPHASPDRIRHVREAVIAKLRDSLEGRAEPSLCACLNEDFPYNLFHLFYTSNYKEKAKGMAPLSDDTDWAWLRPNLLAACRECPAKLLPQVIIAVQHEEGRRDPDRVLYKYDHPRLEALFGEDTQNLLALIAAGFPINPAFKRETAYRVELAIEKAKNLVKSAL